jgi:hypothetical protein
MKARVNPRITRHMQEHTLLERVYSDESATKSTDNEEEAKDKCKRLMSLMEL